MTTADQDHGPRRAGPDHSGQVRVASGNEDQYAAWNDDEGRQWAAHSEFFDASVRHLHDALMTAAAIEPGMRVLDLGCGSGQCTREAARRASPGGTALGLDLSLPMLRVARAIAEQEGVDGADFVQADAQVHPLPEAGFDVALSRTGTMFFADQVAAFTHVARALRPGGRLAMVSWRAAAENEWLRAMGQALRPGAVPPTPPEDAPTPFRHADPARTRAILAAAGFEGVDLRPLDVAMYFGSDAAEGFGVLRDLLGWMVRDLDTEAETEAFGRLRELLVAHETPEGVAFGCAAWLITARRGGA